MIRDARERILTIDVPVANAIETARDERGLADRARHLERLAAVATRAFVISRGPQHPEGEERLPLRPAVAFHVRRLECSDEVVVRARKCAECLLRPTAGGEKRRIGTSAELLRGSRRALELLQRLACGAKRERVDGGGACVAMRGLPIARLERMIREGLGRLLRRVGRLPLEGGGDRTVERHALAREHARANGLARERMAERELIGRLLGHELRSHELLHEQHELRFIV